ncbi:hypothetical protein [Hymenobacter psychrotolerans]|uniref:hypothetical protein n=1 Tax=Hymenobacter psychrotolerans TaxID=344998 RepID=UPI0009340FB0|nr:hypothetical protein [Hymenobacter psychrotolerans]
MFLVIVYSVLYTLGILDYAPAPDTIIRWDAGWFESIRTNGYVYVPDGQSNVPFFPLFPYLWRLLGVEGLGISIVNFGLLLLGAALLGRTFALRKGQILVLLSVPSVFICLVPYAEALFFLFGAVLLCGLHRQKLGLTLLGLLGCCLSRSAATLFLPAFILAESLACTSRALLPLLALRLGTGLLTIAAALGIVMFLHYQATGDPLIFFAAHEQWGHKIDWQLYPQMSSSSGLIMVWLDAIALLAGLVAALACLGLGIRWIWNWFRQGPAPVAPSRALTFSMGYVLAAICFILFYQAGNTVGSSRYVLATPFWGALLAQLSLWWELPKTTRWKSAALMSGLVLAVAVWFGWPTKFPGFVPLQASWLLFVWVIYLIAHVLAASKNWRYNREVQAALYISNVVYQLFLLNLFLGMVWLG